MFKGINRIPRLLGLREECRTAGLLQDSKDGGAVGLGGPSGGGKQMTSVQNGEFAKNCRKRSQETLGH